MTKFAFEVPLEHLWDFDPIQDFTFGLSFLLEEPTYEEYFGGKCEAGELVYLDNGWNETLIAATPNEMARLWYKYQPTAVASPDSDQWKSIEIFDAFIELTRLIPAKSILSIFRNLEEQAVFLGRQGPTATSYWWVDSIDTTKLGKVHCLGLFDLDLVRRYQPPTLDTSQPIKMALRGERFEDWDGKRRQHPTRKVDSTVGTRLSRAWDYFNLHLTDTQLELAIHNCEALKAAVNADRQVPSNY